jgi:hypothetical protein
MTLANALTFDEAPADFRATSERRLARNGEAPADDDTRQNRVQGQMRETFSMVKAPKMETLLV